MATFVNQLRRTVGIELSETAKKNLRTAEMVLVAVLIFIQISIFQRKSVVPGCLALMVAAGGCLVRKEKFVDIGLVNFSCFLIPAGIFAGKTILKGVVHFDEKSWSGLALCLVGYFSWACLQQFALNSFLVRRLEQYGVAREKIPLWAGCLFSLCHFPNPVLMPVTLFGGMEMSNLFLRMKSKNIYWLASPHAAVAILLLRKISVTWHHNFAVGPAFWR
jgi:hypothetical protein